MFPHKKLDWLIGRLETEAQSKAEDPTAQLAYARALLSKGVFHGGGEQWCAQALRQAQRVLKDDGQNPEALVLAGISLVGMNRNENARTYLDEALRLAPDRGDLHLALGAMFRADGNRNLAVRHLEHACELEPDSWEPHLYLGRALSEAAANDGSTNRTLEQAQYHLVKALQGSPAPDIQAPALRDLGRTCLLLGRYSEAEKLFLRLREHPRYRHRARQHLGQVAYALGKYKNAIHHLRTYLEDNPQDAGAYVLIAKAYLQLDELARAREACNKALLLDTHNTEARYTLGCTVLEEGDPTEALRIFRVNLREHPEHLPTYLEMVRTRRMGGDVDWIVQALNHEVGDFDRLDDGETGALLRVATRDRIAILLDELRAIGPSSAGPVLSTISKTRHEGLRFQLWEAATLLAASQAADDVALKLREPGRHFSVVLGRQAFTVALQVPEPLLTRGLTITEDDLRREAIDRCGPANDVTTHRDNIEKTRKEARAYQALLLLAIARRQTRAGRNLLSHWVQTADSELATVAQIGLSVFGDPDAVRLLRETAHGLGRLSSVDSLLAWLAPPRDDQGPRPLGREDTAHCTACGRTAHDAHHLMAGSQAVLCDHCVEHVGRNRSQLASVDDARCQLCGRSTYEARGMFRYNGVDVCARCLDLSLGLLEREVVDQFLATW
jgi:tetratricopeptide (TPR) repeat protein